MKKTSKLILALLVMLCILLSFPLNAGALSAETQDGLEVNISTDKTEYSIDYDVQVCVDVKNTNSHKVEDVSINTVLPDGFELTKGTLSATDIDIESEDKYTLEIVAKLSDEHKGNKENATDDNTDPASKPKTDSPNTGDSLNVAVLIILLIALIVGLILAIKYKKSAKLLSLLLCFAVMLSMLPISAFAAEKEIGSISVDKTITVDDKDYLIESTVKYITPSKEVSENGNEVVPEEVAQLFGVDTDEYDSDNDGLSNYDEIYVTGTNPTLTDADNDGVLDADEDADEDGLTNAEELEKGTDLAKADTDCDGISDYKEIYEINTDPCKIDTDEDGLNDGDEIVLGLDPLVQKTDGATLDSKRKFTQELSKTNIDEQLTLDDNKAVPSLTLTTNGNINSRVIITTADINDYGDSRAVVGKPIDIIGDNIGEGTISFDLNSHDTAFSVDNDGGIFNTALICKYNEDGSTEYLDTTFDAENNIVSASVSSEGEYFVLDVKNLFDELGVVMPESCESKNASVTSTESSDSENDTDVEIEAMAQADIVFMIDTTGSMREEIDNVKDNVEYFVDALKEKGVSAGLALVDYQDIEANGYESTKVHKNSASNWFYDMEAYKDAISTLSLGDGGDVPECAVDALETGRLIDMRASAGKIFVLVTDADYKDNNRYGIPSMSAEIELLKNAGVNCVVVSPSYEQITYYDLYTETNGSWINIYGDFYSDLMALADKIGNDIVGDGYWIYLDGPVPVPARLDEKPMEGSTVDTDKDGICDIDELGSVTPSGSIDLDDLITKVSQGAITGTNYGTVMTYKYSSSPVSSDTDFDGTDDPEDTVPKSNDFKGVMHYDLEGTMKTCNVDFTMDYRDLIDVDNSVYSKDLSKLSILYASDIYQDLYIEFTDGAIGGNDVPTTFGTILGLEDPTSYKIKSNDYNVDKDDVTEFFVGHKKITYNGTDTEVVVVSVRGTNATNAEWSSNFDVGADTKEYYDAVGYEHPDWRNKINHKGFDVAANRVYDKLTGYLSTYVDYNSQTSILITGHSRGAAIANILSQMFEDNSSYKVYGYTFATPNSTTSPDADSYNNIFNIINEDDIIPFLPLEHWDFTNYGVTKSISVNSYYENKLIGAAEGTFEWLIGVDYNDDGGTQRTLDCFKEIVNCREEIYILDTTGDGAVWENNVGHITKAGAEKELVELSATLEKEKLLKFCRLSVVGSGISYHVEVNYCPAYLMQILSNMTTGVGPILGHDVRGKYATAKASFVASSGKVVVGGMTHPHMQPTYYLIARNDFLPLN